MSRAPSIAAVARGGLPEFVLAEGLSPWQRLTLVSIPLADKRARAVAKACPALARGLGAEYAERSAAYARVTPPPDAGALADSLAFSRVLAREQRLPDDARIERMLATTRIKLRHNRFAARRGSPAGAGRRTSVVRDNGFDL